MLPHRMHVETHILGPDEHPDELDLIRAGDLSRPAAMAWFNAAHQAAHDRGQHLPQAIVRGVERLATDRAHGVQLAQLREQLAPLCPCVDAPEQACPLHGDGVTFVDRVRKLEALLAAAYAYIPEVDSGERFGDLFDAVHALRPIAGVK